MARSFVSRLEKQQKKSKIILGLFIVVIMVGSTLGLFIGGNQTPTNGLTYTNENDEEFFFEFGNGQYTSEINGNEVLFYSLPSDASRINITQEAYQTIIDSNAFVITFNPKTKDIQYIEQARFDLTFDLSNFNKYLLSAVTKKDPLYDLKTITCANATSQIPVIYMESSNSTYASKEGDCIVLKGTRSDFLRYRDYILYKLYGVI